MSTERRSLSAGDRPHTRWLTSRVGACTDRIGTPCSSDRRRSSAGSCVAGSDHTMTSTPSYPSSAATSNANAARRGYTEAVDSVTGTACASRGSAMLRTIAVAAGRTLTNGCPPVARTASSE